MLNQLKQHTQDFNNLFIWSRFTVTKPKEGEVKHCASCYGQILPTQTMLVNEYGTTMHISPIACYRGQDANKE